MKTSEIREKFIQFFESKSHIHLPSSSLIPSGDATLLFTNAGMVQFKDNFTGKANPKNKRAVTIQKCVRAGGKHNDLENVGFTARHHTFFEMLGNFSFGDYFKEEAIAFAWEFLTQELKIPKDKLYITCHHTDTESADIWHEKMNIPRDRIFFKGDKDNFWEMGETGPCGPCSEIFYDHGEKHADPTVDTSECLLDDESRYVEVWNLVFMQYEKYRDGSEIKKKSLPKPSVDTGAGLERLAAALQGTYNNFDSDGFQVIIKKIENISSKKYSDFPQMMRVVADHARSTSLLLSDGVLPSNEGRGYVLRRIIRRAVRYLDLLEVKTTSLYTLVDVVFDSLVQIFPDIRNNQQFVEKYLRLEEDSFRKTLSSGLKLLEKEIQNLKSSSKTKLSGKSTFDLYDTHGFPIDLTEMILKENNLSLDIDGFNAEMKKQKDRSKKSGNFSASENDNELFYKSFEKNGATNFLGYELLESDSKLLDIIELKDKSALIFDQSPFYAEGGGQLGDIGEIYQSNNLIGLVENTLKPVDGLHIHLTKSTNNFKIGDTYKLLVNKKNRNLTKCNHTATHLLQAALIEVLGKHIKQAGSSVGPERLRFDFTHPEKLSKEDISEIENIVNTKIQDAIDVSPSSVKKDEAIKMGAMALFGEKYGDIVRIINIPGFSLELCGGTHVQNTSEISYFKILTEGSLSTGVRRIEAMTNVGAFNFVNQKLSTLDEIETISNTKDKKLVEKIVKMKKEILSANKKISQLQEKIQTINAQDVLDSDTIELSSGLTFKHIQASPEMDIRKLGDLFIDKHPKGLVLITSNKGNKSMVLLKTYNNNENLDCSNLLKDVASKFGAKGGGKKAMAQGSISSDDLAGFTKEMTEKIFSLYNS